METATVLAGGRRLTLMGRHPTYLRGLDGADTDQGMLARAVADLPAGSVLLDVGANIGFTALSMAAQRPDCHVLAFEGVPSNAACLRRNVEANRIGNVEVVAAAVSHAPGTVTMTDNGPWSYASEAGPIRCPAVTLDGYARPEVRFIKVDVEGFEPNVLAGARALLAARPLMAIEFNTWALLLHHYDPLVFAETLWAHFEILAVLAAERECDIPGRGEDLVHMNLTEHGCVSDLLLRPRSELPDLAAMTETPACRQLRADLAAMQSSTSWRVTAPMRAVRTFLSARRRTKFL